VEPIQGEAAVVPVQLEPAVMPACKRLEPERPNMAVTVELAEIPTGMVMLAVYTAAAQAQGEPLLVVTAAVLEPRANSGLPIHQTQQ